MELVDRVSKLPDATGRLPKRLKVLLGDKAYGTPANWLACRRRGIAPLLGRPGSTFATGLGSTRYVVERTLACFGHCRRIKLCYERTGAHFQAFHELAATLLCARRLFMLD
jgi:hypothetical protein